MRNLFAVACLLSVICSGSTLGANSFLKSDRESRNAKADLAVFQLKAGHPDQAALLIRELLISLQLELPMDAQFSKNSPHVYAESPKQLKVFFDSVIRRLDDQSDTKQIIYSIIDNTVPRDYEKQLSAFSKRLQNALAQLRALEHVSDREELKYGDPLTSLSTNPEDKSDPNLRKTSLEKLGISFNQLAKDAQQMPVGDARAALGLSKLALAANYAEHYALGEKFARQAIQHFDAIENDLPAVNQVKITLAYTLMKQAKIEDFKAVRDALLQNIDGQKRLLVTLARFTEASGDNAGAAAINKRVLDKN